MFIPAINSFHATQALSWSEHLCSGGSRCRCVLEALFDREITGAALPLCSGFTGFTESFMFKYRSYTFSYQLNDSSTYRIPLYPCFIAPHTASRVSLAIPEGPHTITAKLLLPSAAIRAASFITTNRRSGRPFSISNVSLAAAASSGVLRFVPVRYKDARKSSLSKACLNSLLAMFWMSDLCRHDQTKCRL